MYPGRVRGLATTDGRAAAVTYNRGRGRGAGEPLRRAVTPSRRFIQNRSVQPPVRHTKRRGYTVRCCCFSFFFRRSYDYIIHADERHVSHASSILSVVNSVANTSLVCLLRMGTASVTGP